MVERPTPSRRPLAGLRNGLLAALIAGSLVACERPAPASLPSAAAYRLPVRELAAEALPAGTTWGRPIARPRIVEQSGHSEYRVESSCSFTTQPGRVEISDDAAAFVRTLELSLVAELDRRGAQVNATHAVPMDLLSGSTLDVDYALEMVEGEVHVEIRGATTHDYELFFVVSEWAAS